jgi:hypothetical protein
MAARLTLDQLVKVRILGGQLIEVVCGHGVCSIVAAFRLANTCRGNGPLAASAGPFARRFRDSLVDLAVDSE